MCVSVRARLLALACVGGGGRGLGREWRDPGRPVMKNEVANQQDAGGVGEMDGPELLAL